MKRNQVEPFGEGRGINLVAFLFKVTGEKMTKGKREVNIVRLGTKTVGGGGILVGSEYGWIKKEAERRGVSYAQVVRDACRAYRKLEKDSVQVDIKRSLPVSF